jgi:glutathione reductase (NADPH)
MVFWMGQILKVGGLVSRWDPVSPQLNWSKFMEAKRTELQRLNKAYASTLGRANVDIIEGRGKILDAHTVEVAGKQYTAKHILVAVGGTPNMIDLPGARWVAAQHAVRCQM